MPKQRDRRKNRLSRRLGRVLLAVCVAGSLTQGLRAQQTWEYSPYAIQVWLAFESAPEFTPPLAAQIERTVTDRAWAVAGAAWDVHMGPSPEALQFDMARHPDQITTEAIQAADPQILKQFDKLFLVGIRDDLTGWLLSVRELDCRTRFWQPTVSRRVVQPRLLAYEVFAALDEAFTPLVRIESSKGKEAQVRVRGGGLLTRERSPAEIGDEAVLLPIIRRNDRLGEPMVNGIQAAPWTFLTITGRKGSVLQCQIHSGMGSPLGGRASSRTVKLALVARPKGDRTDLVLETQGDDPQPLDGYEIYAKDPETEESERIGMTDWRGTVHLRRSKQPLLIYYVRNGGRLLARLPIVPGLEAQVTAQVINDDQRLQAEGFVKGLQNRVMDLVARRELYIARFRRHLKQKEFAEAQALLEEFRGLQTRADLARQIDQQEQRVRSPDRRVQARIDQLFSDTRQLLTKFLDPRTANTLTEELLQAQQSG
jgi:hypothetical protein